MFKAFLYSFGLPEQIYNLRLANIEITVFIPLLYFYILAHYLMDLENKETKHSRAYEYDLASSINDIISPKQAERKFNCLFKRYVFTDEILIYFQLANISNWLTFLDKYDNQEVKEAVREVKEAEDKKQKYLKRILKSTRR